MRGIGASLAVGFVLFFFSETLFWGRPGRAPLGELGATWLAYSALAALLLGSLRAFEVRDHAAIYLCAALFGWSCEGVLAGTLYDAFPLQISWTGLAWHANLSVGAGWLGLNFALRHSFKRAALWAALLGAFWGAWAVMWWQPQEGGIVTPWPAFTAHALGQSIFVALALWISSRLLRPSSPLSPLGGKITLGLMTLWFGVAIVPARPHALPIAPLLGALIYFSLRRRRDSGARSTRLVLDRLCEPLSLRRCAAILAMPLTASATYGFFSHQNLVVATNLVAFWVLMPLGFVLLGLSLRAIWRPIANPLQ